MFVSMIIIFKFLLILVKVTYVCIFGQDVAIFVIYFNRVQDNE